MDVATDVRGGWVGGDQRQPASTMNGGKWRSIMINKIVYSTAYWYKIEIFEQITGYGY